VTRKPAASRAELRVDVSGDRRVAEEIIVEMRALARRYGLEMPEARIVKVRGVGSSAKTPLPPRRATPRSRRASPK
jgi:hypothetical protein